MNTLPLLSAKFWRGCCGILPLVLLSACAKQGITPQIAAAPTPAPKVSAEQIANLDLQLIEKMEAQQKWYAALAYLDAYLKDHSPSPRGLLLQGRAYAATQQNDKARTCFAQLRGTGLAALGNQGLGLLAAREGHLAAAIRYFRHASEEAPVNAEILNDLGFAYLQRNELSEAKNALFRAGELAPQELRIWSNITLYYLLQGETLQAQEVIADHQISWAGQKAIHQEYQRLRPSNNTNTAGNGGPESAANLPNQPLLQRFSNDRTAPADAKRSQP